LIYTLFFYRTCSRSSVIQKLLGLRNLMLQRLLILPMMRMMWILRSVCAHLMAKAVVATDWSSCWRTSKWKRTRCFLNYVFMLWLFWIPSVNLSVIFIVLLGYASSCSWLHDLWVIHILILILIWMHLYNLCPMSKNYFFAVVISF